MKFERLGEKITQVRGISYKPNDMSSIPMSDYVPILKANNIQEEGIDTRDLIYIHKSKVRPEQFIKKGDLLLAASSGSKEIVGKNIYFESDFDGSFGAFCKLVRPKKNINPRYLATFFKSVPYKRHIRKLLSGALINNLKNEYIDSLLIPDISNSDQIHIATLLSKAENLISQRKESIRLLDSFLKSVFLEMFGNPATNPKNWEEKKFGDIFETIRYGTGSPPEYKNEGIPFIRATNIKKGRITRKDLVFISEEEAKKIEKCQIKTGDLIIVRSGANTGDATTIPIEFNGAYAAYDLIVTLNYSSAIFFNELINSNYGRTKIKPLTRRSGQPHLNSDQVKSLKFYYPPLALQTQFAQIVEKTEVIKTQYQQSLQELENLYGSLSQRAFRGELSLKDEGVLMAAEPEGKYF